jgi:hypothetical protein
MSRSALSRMQCALAAIAIAAGGCAAQAGQTGPADFAADTGPEATAVDQPRVVAQITTDEGARITFYNERAAGDDPVISVAIANATATPVVDAVLAQQPSALELFVALQPGRAAPDELVREHRLLAAIDAAYTPQPRLLTAASAIGSPPESFACAGNYAGWLAAFNAWAPPLDGKYTATNVGATSGYVGYAPKFYFDVCRVTASSFGYVVRTERRINANDAWAIFDNGSPLLLNQRYRFFRNTFTCSSFQYRLFVEPSGGSYFRGATWADEWSCAITL